MEEEYHRAIATNIVQELLYQRKHPHGNDSHDKDKNDKEVTGTADKKGNSASNKKSRTGLVRKLSFSINIH